MSVIETAIGLGAGAAGAVSQALQNKKMRDFEAEQSQLQREWNEKMYNQQNAWNYEMWQKQNEYNTPFAQKERLLEAGLNPLFYGLDGTGNAGALESAQPLGYDRASVGNQLNPITAGLNASMDASMRIAQVQNLRANTAKQNNETQTETYRREQIIAQTEETRQKIQNLLASKDLTDAQRRQIEASIPWIDKINEARLGQIEAETKLTDAQRNRIDELLPGEKELQNMTLKQIEHYIDVLDGQKALLSAQTKLTWKDIENYALNRMTNGVFGSGLSLQNFLRFIGVDGAAGAGSGRGPKNPQGDMMYVDPGNK